jgi:hypothetical protein
LMQMHTVGSTVSLVPCYVDDVATYRYACRGQSYLLAAYSEVLARSSSLVKLASPATPDRVTGDPASAVGPIASLPGSKLAETIWDR